MRITKVLILLIIAAWPLSGAGQPSADASATGISRAFNPAISVNGLFYAMTSSEDDPLWGELGLAPGFHVQEMSVEMTANVDIYFQAKVVLAATEDTGLELEEGFLTTLAMPVPLKIRGGQMLNTFGRHNLKHLHHMAFAEPPMVLAQIFGPDLNELGVEASYLVPLPWYMDLTVGAINGDNPYLFESGRQNDYAYLAHLDNLWDLNDEITMRLGGSYLYGARGTEFSAPAGIDSGIDNIFSHVWGVDFQVKWNPLDSARPQSFILQGEYMEAALDLDGDFTNPLRGGFVQALAQLDKRWWVQARYGWFYRSKELHNFFPEPDLLVYNGGRGLYGDRWSLAAAYVPTEFSAFRIQYNMVRIGGQWEQQLVGQVNFTIGSHPAHEY